MDHLTYENLCSVENDVCEMIREIIDEYEEDYKDSINELYGDEYDEIKRLEPDMDIINYDDLERWRFNEGDDMWDLFSKRYGYKVHLEPWVVCEMIREIYDEYPDINASWKWEDIFNTYVFMHASNIIEEKRECQDERLEKYIEIRRKHCSRVIQRQWEKCRWNPMYQMCHICQLKDLEINCGVSFDESGKMVKVI